jgi:hypothetical protein
MEYLSVSSKKKVIIDLDVAETPLPYGKADGKAQKKADAKTDGKVKGKADGKAAAQGGSEPGLRGIGLLAEQGLHAALKHGYAKPGDRFEVEVDGKVIDLVRKNGDLVEIQTGNFGKIRDKIRQLAVSHKILLVHPIVVKKTIVVIDPATGEILSRRASPKHEGPLALFDELVYFPDALTLPKLQLELALVEVEEIRLKNRKTGWRQRDKVLDRRLVAISGALRLSQVKDVEKLFSKKLPADFTVPELSAYLGLNARQTGKIVYSLKNMGFVRQDGKKGRAYRYVR